MSRCYLLEFILVLFTFVVLFDSPAWADLQNYTFVLESTSITRLCGTYSRVILNGQLPGPTLYVRNGDTLNVVVYNKAQHNASIHWHGVRQIRNSWADGPEYITQCPIQPGGKFTYTFTIIGQEGTLWWHAHVSWLRGTVHGAMVILPKKGSSYPFTQPHAELPIVLGTKLCICGGPLVDFLLKSGGSKYLEFKSMEGSYIWSGLGQGLTPVLDSRASIFQDRTLSLVEKKHLMRFFKLIQNQEKLSQEDLESSFVHFLDQQCMPSSIKSYSL